MRNTKIRKFEHKNTEMRTQKYENSIPKLREFEPKNKKNSEQKCEHKNTKIRTQKYENSEQKYENANIKY